MDKLVALCKRRGFIFPGSELYGGLNGTWDLGPLGVLLAQNIKHEWWKSVVLKREDVVGLDSSILHHPKVWEASGHVASFTDPLIECKVCHERFRADHKDQIAKHEKAHPNPAWTDIKSFNLMFKTFLGPIDDEKNKTYLRPETAQGIFINFKNVVETSRVKIPFGIAQIGKGFRNEITTGNFLFRVREFEMMELEFFVKPGTDKKWHDLWKQERYNWWLRLGIRKENIKLVDLPREDIAHYSKGTTEVWYNWPFMSFGELEGIANRGDYDLSQQAKYSGRDLSYFDQKDNERYIPYVIEPSVGIGRAMLAFLIDAYYEEEKRVVLRLHPKLSPIKIAVFPLLGNKNELITKAKDLYKTLKTSFEGEVAFDDRGNIGKRYLYQDEIGTPWCVTVDFDTLKDNTVTVRDRNSTKQERVAIGDMLTFFTRLLQ
ncbi:MAG: glycine--tRNA ligase [Candidatus Levybacteria bacterium]|nr:glycine--tRNA ligase [Candidatus Levybacteria bacterium]